MKVWFASVKKLEMMNFRDEDVQQCMLAAYCSIYDVEGSRNIFEDVLSDYNAEVEHCGPSVLVENTNDRLEKLFD